MIGFTELLDFQISSELGHLVSPSTTEATSSAIAVTAAGVAIGRSTVAAAVRETI